MLNMVKIEEFTEAIGQKITGFKEKDNSLWIILDDDVILIDFPDIRMRCLGCIGNMEKSKERIGYED